MKTVRTLWYVDASGLKTGGNYCIMEVGKSLDNGDSPIAVVPDRFAAFLIAATPSLLAALELACSEFPPHRDGMDSPLPVGIKAARAAIAKSKGAQP